MYTFKNNNSYLVIKYVIFKSNKINSWLQQYNTECMIVIRMVLFIKRLVLKNFEKSSGLCTFSISDSLRKNLTSVTNIVNLIHILTQEF